MAAAACSACLCLAGFDGKGENACKGLMYMRWKQSFLHYRKAFVLLEKAMSIASPSDTERAGLVHFFELTFELALKMLKDYLEKEGFSVASPRQAIKQAFQVGLIRDGQVWMDALKDRSLTVHIYEKEIAIAVEQKIRKAYFPAVAELYHEFNAKVE
jgi:nucleotidyltransferase substrate binding protein (TIGR01987 family)